MSNRGRILTLGVQIIDEEKAKWMWKNLGGEGRGTDGTGVEVFCMGDGDQMEELNDLQDKCKCQDNDGYTE